MATNGLKQAKATPLGLIPESIVARKYLNVCDRTLRRERHRGRISFYRVGIRIYYSEEQIRSYLNQYCASDACVAA